MRLNLKENGEYFLAENSTHENFCHVPLRENWWGWDREVEVEAEAETGSGSPGLALWTSRPII